MKIIFLLLLSLPIYAQNVTNTEIFVFNIQKNGNDLMIENGINISNNRGYDNQPSFFSKDSLLFSKTQDQQTEIALFSFRDSTTSWVTNTGAGSEYSPQRIPSTNDIAAVRLDTTGLQLLYRYNLKSGESTVLLPDLKVGYFAFAYDDHLLTAVLNDSTMDLFLTDRKKRTSQKIVPNVGRSIHKVPGINSLSYTVGNDENNLDLYILDLKEAEPQSYYLTTLPKGSQDYTWLDKNNIVLGNGSKLLVYNILGSNAWTPVADLSTFHLNNITRIAVNDDATRIAVAADVLTEEK